MTALAKLVADAADLAKRLNSTVEDLTRRVETLEKSDAAFRSGRPAHPNTALAVLLSTAARPGAAE